MKGFLVYILILLTSLQVYGTDEVAFQNTHVVVFVLDGEKGVFSGERAEFYEGLMKEKFPNDKVISVVVNGSEHVNSSEFSLQREVADRLSSQIVGHEKIVSLSIGTHGRKGYVGKDFNASFELTGLGIIHERKLSEGIKIAFSPLVGRFDSNVKILYQSCQSMCGIRKSSLGKRHLKFLSFLGIQNAKLYGGKINTNRRDYINYNQERLQDIAYNHKYARLQKLNIFWLITAHVALVAGVTYNVMLPSYEGISWSSAGVALMGYIFPIRQMYKNQMKVHGLGQESHRMVSEMEKAGNTPKWSMAFRELEVKNKKVHSVKNLQNLYSHWWPSSVKSCSVSFK